MNTFLSPSISYVFSFVFCSRHIVTLLTCLSMACPILQHYKQDIVHTLSIFSLLSLYLVSNFVKYYINPESLMHIEACIYCWPSSLLSATAVRSDFDYGAVAASGDYFTYCWHRSIPLVGGERHSSKHSESLWIYPYH